MRIELDGTPNNVVENSIYLHSAAMQIQFLAQTLDQFVFATSQPVTDNPSHDFVQLIVCVCGKW